MTRLFPTLLGLLVLNACASTQVTERRFENLDPVWAVNDRVDTPKPERREFITLMYQVDNYFLRRLTRVMEVPLDQRALDVNALGEVPNSTWFTNRIGVKELTPEDILRGPGDGGRADRSESWKITGTKIGGASVGFIFKDSSGDKFLLKFDSPGIPDLETGADVVVQRLMWAVGYSVPADNVEIITRDRLVLAEGAKVEDIFGNKRPMTIEDLEERLTKVDHMGQGKIRTQTSKFLPGYPIGGFAHEGMRPDDPNDLIPHEHRRSVRGMRVFFSWVGHTDVKEDNVLDMWVEDPTDPEKHYIVHNLVDFGKGMGVFGLAGRYENSGYAHSNLDLSYATRSMFTLGLWKRPWEDVKDSEIPGVGRFDSENFEFETWSPQYPYIPFNYMDHNDAFWGTKILMRLGPAHIRAAVQAAQYTDPRAEDYLTRTLIARQRIIGDYWFKRVNPLDQFVVDASEQRPQLCFEDLLRKYELGTEAGSTYRLQTFDYYGHPLRTDTEKGVEPGEDARVCVPVDAAAPTESYTIVRVDTSRKNPEDGEELNPIYVHLARNPAGELRVIGVDRP